MKKTLVFYVLSVLTVAGFLGCSPQTGDTDSASYQATGIKIGEVTSNSAIIWTRLTAADRRVGKEGGIPEVVYLNEKTGNYEKMRGRPNATPKVIFPEGKTVRTIEGAVPGAPGKIRVLYKTPSESQWHKTPWQNVDPERDFTRQIHLKDLRPKTTYLIRSEANSGNIVEGQFRTAPDLDQQSRVLFTVTTGQAYNDMDCPDGFKMYASMLNLDPDFFVHTGDILYYDKLGKTLDLARWHWQRTYSLPTNVKFHRNVASYFIKDDHDTLMDDCWPTKKTRYMGDFTFEQGVKLFPQQVPMGDKTYRTVRWGKDLQVWFVEGRDYRSPNNMPDGPEKSIWGKKQMNWFINTVQASDATFRILITPTPIVGPDRIKKADNHSNTTFLHEGEKLRAFLSKQNNMFVVCGDRHWQYVSVDPKTGVKEYSCGPASDDHAGGFRMKDRSEMHKYLNVTGGFLSVTVERIGGRARAVFTHHNVDGTVNNIDVVNAVERGIQRTQ